MQPPSNSATPQSTSFALVLVLSLLHLKLKLKLCSQVDAKSLFELGGVASSLGPISLQKLLVALSRRRVFGAVS